MMSLSPAPSDELTCSAATRAKLDHPVVDADGHVLEVEPVLLDFLKDVAGAEMVSRYEKFMTDRPYDAWHDMSWEERFTKRPMRPAFWFTPARNTLDRATAMLPGLMRARLDDFGLDVSILYTTQGLAVWRMGDAEPRRATIRASPPCASVSSKAVLVGPAVSTTTSSNTGRSRICRCCARRSIRRRSIEI